MARDPTRFPWWDRGTAAPTPDRTLTCAAPSPRSHRSGCNAGSLPSWFGASIRQSTRARWVPASPCKSGGKPGPIQPNVPVWMDGLGNLQPRRARPYVEVDTPSVEQGPSSPTLNVGAHRIDLVRQTPSVKVNLATPQCLQFERGEPDEHRRCCRKNGVEAPHYPDGRRPLQPPDLQKTAAAGYQVLCPDWSSIEEPRSHHAGVQPAHSDAGLAEHVL